MLSEYIKAFLKIEGICTESSDDHIRALDDQHNKEKKDKAIRRASSKTSNNQYVDLLNPENMSTDTFLNLNSYLPRGTQASPKKKRN